MPAFVAFQQTGGAGRDLATLTSLQILSAVPEPGTLALYGIAALSLAMAKRRGKASR